MREVHLFPGHARRAEVLTTAQAAAALPLAEGFHHVREAAARHAAEVRTFGDHEAVIAADAAGFERAVTAAVADLRVDALIADPEELRAARGIVGDLFAVMRGRRHAE
ncbi:hypothetical protein ASG52_19850 [Methylobacterium sp. Leaf456]|uniref:DUF6074 family protein n=1 Tax=Methylobacterium sp. Leaf456 TaxID=1736382 RepID=UPI0006FDE9DE|nr:DUF6074 family protein [Methylobacterium sp. Leaf456]KQT59982.1 hypothetical protein ASG52_19850 [Methylobacterium sp. Leaf456]